VSDEFVLITLLTLMNIVLNELAHVGPVMFADNEIESVSDTVVTHHESIMMSHCDQQSHFFRDIHLILMIKNIFLQFS